MYVKHIDSSSTFVVVAAAATLERAKQEMFEKKEREFREEQLKEKRMCMKVHFKEKSIAELKKNIE